jgi:hypothetical protein
MATTTASVIALTPKELDDRRMAVESAISSLRIEALELDAVPNRILEQYSLGEISIDEMSRLIHAYTATIV